MLDGGGTTSAWARSDSTFILYVAFAVALTLIALAAAFGGGGQADSGRAVGGRDGRADGAS